MHELSPNRYALPLVEELLNEREKLKVDLVHENGVKIIDCGVNVPGCWEAGVKYASICLGGLAQVRLHWSDFNGLCWPAVEVITDHPITACLASQYAGWPIKNGEHIAMGSGPGRAVLHEGELFKKFGCGDDSKSMIFCLESKELPTNAALEHILERCKCDPANLYILAAPTSSLVGSVQVSARALETGLSKLMELGYDLNKVVSGWSICPIPPVTNDDLLAMGRTNDAIIYGSTVYFNLQDEDKNLSSLVKLIPSSSTNDYGQPFAQIYKRYGNFYDLDPLLFSPAEVWLTNINSGCSYHAGAIRTDILRQSFGLN